MPTLYCKIESLEELFSSSGTMELFGVTESDYETQRWESDEGVDVYNISIYAKKNKSIYNNIIHILLNIRIEKILSESLFFIRNGKETLTRGERPRNPWVKIFYKNVERGKRRKSGSYIYRIYTQEEPEYIEVISISLPFDGHELPSFRTDVVSETHSLPGKDEHWFLNLYHVGQGMCSVFHNNENGFILDCGAGKPINRKRYERGNFVNQLRNLIQKISVRSKLKFILSHADRDHFCILNWDSSIFNAIDTFYVPADAKALALHSKETKRMTKGIKTNLSFSNSFSDITIYRSKPHITLQGGDNMECLIVQCSSDGKNALIPGDYPYSAMEIDNNFYIQNAWNAKYDIVVVPHHGALESAVSVPYPKNGQSIAFFSAGTHKKYNHPRAETIQSHENAKYNIINNNKLDNIIEINVV